MLDQASPGKYSVTNLGACGSTMLKKSNSPYWQRPQFKALSEVGKMDGWGGGGGAVRSLSLQSTAD